MHRSIAPVIATLAAALLSGAALAQEAIPATFPVQPAPAATSQTTRAAVLAEVAAARAAGQLDPFDSDAHLRPPVNGVPTFIARWFQPDAAPVHAEGRSRAEVRAEVAAARRAGQLDPFNPLADLAPPSNVIAPASTTLAGSSR